MDATIGDPLLAASVERAFEKQPLPEFWEQATARAMIVSVVLSVVFGFVTLQIQMSTGVVPGLNMPISVLSFIFLKWFVSLLRTCGLPGSEPFTRQENLLVLTTVTTVGNLALTGGFALYIVAMTSTVAKSLGETNPDPRDIVDNFPTGQWMLFLLLIGLMSVLTSVPLNQVFITVALILTDGIYNFITLLIAAFLDFRQKQQETDTVVGNYLRKHPSLNYDDRRRIEVFLENKIPASLPVAAYAVCAIICGIVIPHIFHQVNFLHVVAMYIIVPVVALTNTYATGLTDWNIAYTYAKFTIFVVAAWVAKPGAIIVALVACGLVVSALHISSQMTQDVKTGYMTLTSQRALIMMQTFGIIIGSVLTPCIFRAFQRSDKVHVPIGAPDSDYPCPYAMLYRAMAVIGTGGVKELPDHCLTFCYVAAGFAVAVNTLSVVSQRKGWKIQMYIPSVTVLALPFFIGSAVAIDMCIGSAVIFLWMKMNSQSAAILSSAVAAGLICGEGLFALPSALFTLFSVEAPMCMKFIHSGKQVDLADSFIRNMSTPAKP
ncbi:hypothetical protein ACQ4PT_041402 [Festuca glaucescens]